MSIKYNLDKMYQLLKSLATSSYDADKYSYSLLQQTKQLEYYYCHMMNQYDKAYFNIWKRPHFHQLAYFNIGRGFPKEIMDGHWCYVVKNMGYKMLVIPCTSIKNFHKINSQYEKTIQVRMEHTSAYCTLHLSDIRAIDIQRIDLRKPIYQVITPRKEIMDFIEENLLK
ncbi:MAG: hypothetical protein LUG46_00600 [Erysipelotrichaceae bacterium]|nr:hypothetical protein [Erysipelotrichaceae bacterium]